MNVSNFSLKNPPTTEPRPSGTAVLKGMGVLLLICLKTDITDMENTIIDEIMPICLHIKVT